MKAAKYNLYLEAGSTFHRRIRLRDHDVMPLDLWYYIFEGNIRVEPGGDLIIQMNEDNGILWVNRVSEAVIHSNEADRPALWQVMDTYLDIALSSTHTEGLSANDRGEFQLELVPITRDPSVVTGVGGYSSATIDVADPVVGLRGTITCDGGTPYSVFAGDDVIHVYNTQSGAEGVYKIYSAIDQKITTHTGLRGSDFTGDSTIVIDKLIPDDSARMRYFKGRVTIDQETVT